MYGVSNFFWSYSSPGLEPMESPPWLLTILSVSLRSAATRSEGPS